ncbi:MAG TPA: hypothetical protein VKU02_29560, partial [Gemmataceae bacterium]|nr:hypothetical protein [Gemmataceae bacterium]
MTLKSPDGKAAFVVTLSPAHAYAIAETQATLGAAGRRADRVLEFQEPAPGIFLPKTVRQTMSWAPAVIIERVIRDVALNIPFAGEELAFRFPEGIHVSDKTRNVEYLWGKGAPTRMFKTTEELGEWTRYQVNADALPVRELAGASSKAAERYEALVREFKNRSHEFVRMSRAAKTEAERQDVARRLRPDSAAYAVRFLNLAKEDPSAPAALYAPTRAATLSGSPV